MSPARDYGTAELCAQGVLSHLDHELATTLLELAGEASPAVGLGVALASWAVARGHVCADLSVLSARGLSVDAEAGPTAVQLPALAGWLADLRQSALVAVGSQSAEAPRPLVLAGPRLYLARYFRYEQALANALSERSHLVFADLDGALLRRGLDALLPAARPGVAGQRRACLVAALRGLCVISGGPGTGKTHTVAKLLQLLQTDRLERSLPPHRICLLAPTGKAAQRLGESIQQNLASAPDSLRACVPREASTIHRALGFQRRTPTRFRHHRERPLPADVVVVDEASMVDLALMAKLVDAVHPRARLVLLGDKDQLTSVEAGAILGDIYGESGDDGYSREMVELARSVAQEPLAESPTRPHAGPQDCMVHLTHVHRYAGEGAIGRLASAVRDGNAVEALALLSTGAPEVELRRVEPGAELAAVFGELVLDRFGRLGVADVREKLAILSRFRLLCAHRRGPFGVEAMNAFVVDHLTRHACLQGHGDWYAGRPVLITANDYALGLFNGDVGVLAAEPESPALSACFPGETPDTLRRLAPGQLPTHETVFAMSVHKSQGSELDEVALVLPERVSPLLTRELVYTGLTRAKRRVTIFGTPAVLEHAIARRVERASGLRERLWQR